MPYESLPPKTERAHSVNIEGREKMKIQGVELSYDEPAPSGGFWSKLFG